MRDSNQHSLCIIPGDGVGIEVIPAAVRVLKKVVPSLQLQPAEAGWAVFQAQGTALPAKTLKTAKSAGAVLFGAVASPSHAVEGYQSPIVALRQALDTFVNLRPARKRLPTSPTKIPGETIDLLVVRENTEGLYNSPEHITTRSTGDKCIISERIISASGTERVARRAFELAEQLGRRVTIVHKANVIRLGDGLWRETCLQVAQEFPHVAVEEALVDAAAYHLVRTPSRYQILLCPNLYGDILSDTASALADGLGMAPSLSLGQTAAIAEPVHGSAPDIAGQGVANPIATILSAAMLCRYWWSLPQAALRLENAVEAVLAQGYRTPDIASSPAQVVDTHTLTEAIIGQLN